MTDSRNIKSILNQVLDEIGNDEEEQPLEYNKEQLIQDIKRLNYLNDNLHKSVDMIKETFSSIANNANFASHHLVKEVEGRTSSFSSGIVKENAKALKSLSEKLTDIAESITEPMMKGIVLVEDIGQLLDRYYSIDEIIEEF